MRLILLLLAALTLAPPNAWACSGDFADSRALEKKGVEREKAEKKAKETFEKAEFIATLRILKTYDDSKAIVQPIKVYKGELPDIFEIAYVSETSACGHEFLPGQKLLLILSEVKGNLLDWGWPSTLIFSGKAGTEALEKLSQENPDPPKKADSKYQVAVTSNLFITKLSEHVLEEKKQQIKPASDEKYINVITNVIKGCKALEKKSPLPPINNPFYIDFEYTIPEKYVFSGKVEKIISIWIQFYHKDLNKLAWPPEVWQNRFLEPVIVNEDHEIYTLTGCNFPAPSTFFEPADSAQ